MITGAEFYNVMCAMVPLYVVMLLAYGSVRWWQVFSPAQCSGVNRFVALFAIPLLSFYFIAANNPYTMNFHFLAADSLQKLLLLAVLASWCLLFRRSSLDWAISFFSLATLPNTLVIGIPLLGGMYGPHSSTLMVQIVVLQGIVWYTLILFLLEFRAARVLIADRFPGANAAAIASIAVDPDVVSLHGGREVLETEADVAGDGRIRVTVRRSSASRRSVSLRFVGATPRASDLSDAEIYSLSRGSSINSSDFYSMVARSSSFGVPSPRPSNYVEDFSNADSKCKAPEKTETEAEIGHKRANREAPLLRAAAEAAINSSGAKEALVAITTAKTEGQRENELRLGIGDEAIVEGLDNGGLTPAEETTMPASTVMMRLILTMMWRKLIRNPNTYSGLIGLLWALVAYRWQLDFPVIISNSIKILSNAGLGMAMFSLGLFMALQPRIIACGNKLAAFAMAVRFLVGPAVAAAAAAIVGLRGDILRIAIVQAALPQGIVPFVFATEYNLHADIVSTAVIFGMLIALPVALVYYILLGL